MFALAVQSVTATELNSFTYNIAATTNTHICSGLLDFLTFKCFKMLEACEAL